MALAGLPRPAGALLALFLAIACLRAEPFISEFMAANTKTLADDDGVFSDWIEVHNPDDAPVDLAGWSLTDAAGNKTKWQFPAVTLPPGGYLIVFASNNNRRDPTRPLHTNFALSAGGEYLGLVRPDGSVASEFAPAFPAQTDDIAYGRVQGPDGPLFGFLRTPTPGVANGGPEALSLAESVKFSRASGPFRDTLAVDLSGAAADQQIRYVLISGANAEAVEPTAASTPYTGSIEISATTLVRAAVFSANGATRGPVASAHYLKLGASLAGFTSQLPIVVLDDLGAGALEKDGIDHASWLYGYGVANNGGGATLGPAPALATPLLTTVRGSSSADFPKKGYNVKLRDDAGGKRSLGLFDLPAHEKWALVAPWAFDLNYINNAFVYALSNRLGRWAPRTRFVEMFFNTGGDDLEREDYAGIYVITDRIEPGDARVNVASLAAGDITETAITGGYILKIDPPDPDEIGWRTEAGIPREEPSAVVLVAPKADDVAPAQLAYIQDYVQRMENALLADRSGGWRQRTHLDYIDRAAWIDHHLLNVFASNPDALHRSAYFTKHRGGKLAAGPVWDFDRAFGAFWDDRSSVIDTWSGVGGQVDVWRSGWWGLLADDPEFRQDWIDRWQTLRRTELSTARLTTLAQTLADQIGGAAAARDVERWPDNASPHGDYAAQISHLKTWLAQRAEWIDRQFAAPPAVTTGGGALTFTAPEGAVLVYTLDGSDPRLMGGGVAPNAITTAGPLVVPASANVHVRTYNEGAQEAFPATPWSAAMGGERSSPLSPIARLANLSSRAVVGSDDRALVIGLVVADVESKRYLARAIGPGLAAFGATGTLADPQLTIIRGDGTTLVRNQGWATSADAARLPAVTRAVGAFPLADDVADSAAVGNLPAGSHSVRIDAASGQAGVALAEVYELDASGRTASVSTRAHVGGADGVLLGGFVLKGPAHQRVLLRAVGPSLEAQGFSGALADPVLTIFAGDNVVATNDRWQDVANAAALEAATQRAGAFALSPASEDAALFLTLAPGAYTVELRGKDDAAGVASLEIFTLP